MNADRLREAADRLAPSWVDAPEFCHPGCVSCQHNRATAALLRTVADSARQQGTDAVWWPLIESGIWTDAHVLADTILGAES